MAEYIERDAAKKKLIAFYGAYDTDGNHERKLALLEIDLALRAIPAADVAPVRRGKNVSKSGFMCSICGFGDFDGFHGYKPRYCPNCGAKMDMDGDGDV